VGEPIPLELLELPVGPALPNFKPPPRFRSARLETYHPQDPSQTQALGRLAQFLPSVFPSNPRRKPFWSRWKRRVGTGLYLDGGFGVGKTHLLAAVYHAAPVDAKIYLSFQELVYLIGALGREEAQKQLGGHQLICLDEFELDDPGNTLIVKTFLAEVFMAGGTIVTTSNTAPSTQGEGRFNAEDFQREIQGIARHFDVILINGPDYRTRQTTGTTLAEDHLYRTLSCDQTGGKKVIGTWSQLMDILASLHPIHYQRLLKGIGALCISGVQTISFQNDALRFVHFVDKLYDQQVQFRAAGSVPLSELFDSSYRNSAYVKKHDRCLSRLKELLAGSELRC
jgi:cell division protein ZapE